MREFDPFQKPFDEIAAADLAVLKTLAEGWYAEYKQSQSGPQTIAKSISSFANTYGGWIFYGVSEDSEGHRTAGGFPGIPIPEIPQYEEWLTQAAAQHISPSPFFNRRVLYGPEPLIGLSEGRAVIVVHAPLGNDAPFVHSSGRIYRRVADSSDPKHETDRHFLDLLWQRGKDARDHFKEFLERERPDADDFDKACPFLRLFFFADPWFEREMRSKMTFRQFAETMRDPIPLPFDQTYTSATGFVARQVIDNDFWRNVLKWEYHSNCVHEITVPLNTFYVDDTNPIAQFLEGYSTCEKFVAECALKGVRNVQIADLSLLWELLLAIFQRLYKVHTEDGSGWPLWMKAQLFGVRRLVPFLDTQDFLSFIKEFGLPVVQASDAVIPPGLSPDSCFKISLPQSEVPASGEPSEAMQFSTINAFVTSHMIGRALGMPTNAFGWEMGFGENPDSEGVTRATNNLLDMGKRYGEATRIRQLRRRSQLRNRN